MPPVISRNSTPKPRLGILFRPPLIDLEDECDELDDYEVLSHAIVGDTIIFSTRKGIYAVDVVLRYWKHLSSLGGEDEFPFRERSVFLDGFWYAFPCTYQSPVSAYDFDWDEGFRGCRELGATRPSCLVKHEASEIMVPMEERTLFIVRAGFPRHAPRNC
ncbi:hypothetical protein RHGRI_000945 [Rhododendron griersonianum]|uniref:Uncharacterized protein n=1 Tax=Rhododendron griersonianum TaxID=479676 RepID=A0AAV6LLA9_9ERIC|nr:hypothetical protein RHGRI_000945 [Rhododendron griersonianum]